MFFLSFSWCFSSSEHGYSRMQFVPFMLQRFSSALRLILYAIDIFLTSRKLERLFGGNSSRFSEKVLKTRKWVFTCFYVMKIHSNDCCTLKKVMIKSWKKILGRYVKLTADCNGTNDSFNALKISLTPLCGATKKILQYGKNNPDGE